MNRISRLNRIGENRPHHPFLFVESDLTQSEGQGVVIPARVFYNQRDRITQTGNRVRVLHKIGTGRGSAVPEEPLILICSHA